MAIGFCSRFRYDLENYLATLGAEAPVRTLEEIAELGVTDPSATKGLTWGLSTTVAPAQMIPPCVDVEGNPRRRALRDAVVAAMDSADVQVIVYPTWNNPPRLLGDLDSPHGNNSPVIAPHAGLPAVTVLMGASQLGYSSWADLSRMPNCWGWPTTMNRPPSTAAHRHCFSSLARD